MTLEEARLLARAAEATHRPGAVAQGGGRLAMRLVAVTGGKGGPGATTLAVGLAGAWAAAGQSVLLVDLDPAGGDVAAHLPVADVRRGVAPLLGSPGVPPGPAAVLAEVAQVNRRVGYAGWSGSPGCGRAAAPPGRAGAAGCRPPHRGGGTWWWSIRGGCCLVGGGGGARGSCVVRVLAVGLTCQGRWPPSGPWAAPVTDHCWPRSRWGSSGRADAAELADALAAPGGVIPADPVGVRRAIQSGQPPTSGRLRRPTARWWPQPTRPAAAPTRNRTASARVAWRGGVGCPGNRSRSALGASDMTAIDPYGQSVADDGLVATVRGDAAELARRLGPARLFTLRKTIRRWCGR